MDAGAEERFVRVNVADPGNHPLVQNERLNWRSPTPQTSSEVAGGKPGFEGLWPEFILQWPEPVCRPVLDPSELALIRKTH
jgi:hypothetical protein